MVEENFKVKADIDELERLIKTLKGGYFLRVGIIGGKAGAQHDKDSGQTNADIGSFHEFGTKKMPRRSFLEDSLKLKLNFNASQFAEMRKQLFKQVFQKNTPEIFLQNLGVKCLQVIEEGFATNGFGLWKPLSKNLKEKRDKDVLTNLAKLDRKAGRLANKANSFDDLDRIEKLRQRVKLLKTNFIEYGSKILTDTGKLRHSISFRVMKKK